MDDAIEESWSESSYEDVAPIYYPLAGHLVERTAVDEGDEVLDVACGTGSVAISAARRGASVEGIDITSSMLELARENAETADVTVDFRQGDARDLPVEEDAFDVTLSSLGHMYGDPPEETAAELLRVTRPGGHIGFTSWTPTSLYPFMASVMTTYLDPADRPDFTEPPFAWGDSSVVANRIEEDVQQLSFDSETVLYPALSPRQFWEDLLSTGGTFSQYLAAVDEDDRPALHDEMVDTIRPYFDDRRNGVELEYLLTVAKR